MTPSEQTISISEAALHEMLDNIPVGIGVTDGAARQDANIVYYNKEWVRMFGFDVKDVRTAEQATQRLYPDPQLRQKMIRLRREAAKRGQKGGANEQMEARAMGGGGEWRDVVTGTAVVNDRMIVTMLDITARKQAELSLSRALEAEREARATAERAERAKSRFLASVSHEIRTPLSALISLAQAMWLESERHELPPEFVAFLDRVRSGGNYLNLILTNLLDVSAIEFGHTPVREDDFYLLDWVSDLKNILDPISRSHRITLLWQLPEDTEMRLRTDQIRLTQILLNLAHNAIKFSGGEDHTVTISLSTASEDLVLSVSDEGPGLPPERLPGLFGEFAQSETARGPAFDHGIGLGLAVVMQNARLLSGHVRAENLTPRGMRFTVSLPLLSPP